LDVPRAISGLRSFAGEIARARNKPDTGRNDLDSGRVLNRLGEALDVADDRRERAVVQAHPSWLSAIDRIICDICIQVEVINSPLVE
jgi:hypothetical protein